VRNLWKLQRESDLPRLPYQLHRYLINPLLMPDWKRYAGEQPTLYSPLELFLDKTWRLSEIVEVKRTSRK
jgi:hypothetical protein